MLKFLTAATTEIDDPQVAGEEIFTQLNLAKNALKHSAAMLVCHYDFVESGVAAAIGEKLPMPVIGCTTHGSGASHGNAAAMDQLAVAVFTADDATALAVASGEIFADTLTENLRDLYARGCAELGAPPKVLLVFAPFGVLQNGDLLVETLDKITGGLPVLGAIASAFPLSFEHCFVMSDREISHTRLSILLLGGEVDPAFFCRVSINSKLAAIAESSVITKATASLVQEIDHLPAWEFLRRNGVSNDVILPMFPILVDYHDGTPPGVGLFNKITREGLSGFNKKMPKGASLMALGISSREEILAVVATTMAEIYQAAARKSRVSAFLVISCIGRAMVIAQDELLEIRECFATLDEIAPVFFLYSAGEICPLMNHSGMLINRFHNFTFCVMML